jgi:hypothetical protein
MSAQLQIKVNSTKTTGRRTNLRERNLIMYATRTGCVERVGQLRCADIRSFNVKTCTAMNHFSDIGMLRRGIMTRIFMKCDWIYSDMVHSNELRVPLDGGISWPIERMESTALHYCIVGTLKTVPKSDAVVWKTLTLFFVFCATKELSIPFFHLTHCILILSEYVGFRP